MNLIKKYRNLTQSQKVVAWGIAVALLFVPALGIVWYLLFVPLGAFFIAREIRDNGKTRLMSVLGRGSPSLRVAN